MGDSIDPNKNIVEEPLPIRLPFDASGLDVRSVIDRAEAMADRFQKRIERQSQAINRLNALLLGEDVEGLTKWTQYEFENGVTSTAPDVYGADTKPVKQREVMEVYGLWSEYSE